METKIGFITILFISLVNFSDVQAARMEYTPIQYLKNYALTVCIGEGFPSNVDIDTESGAAAQGYIELGAFPIEAYHDAAKLAKKYLVKKYESYYGEKYRLTLMKCIDLFHSKELEQLAQKYAKQEYSK